MLVEQVTPVAVVSTIEDEALGMCARVLEEIDLSVRVDTTLPGGAGHALVVDEELGHTLVSHHERNDRVGHDGVQALGKQHGLAGAHVHHLDPELLRSLSEGGAEQRIAEAVLAGSHAERNSCLLLYQLFQGADGAVGTNHQRIAVATVARRAQVHRQPVGDDGGGR